MFDELDKTVDKFYKDIESSGLKLKGGRMEYEVKYILIAKVDNEVVFESEYDDTFELQSELYKPEEVVEKKLKELDGEIDEY